jgi:hypothetical protein
MDWHGVTHLLKCSQEYPYLVIKFCPDLGLKGVVDCLK